MLKKEKRSALGRGLDALLPMELGETESDQTGSSRQFFHCPIDAIAPNPSQPRKEMNDEALGQLAMSIREKGVLLPLVVRQTGKRQYEIIAGERRWRAAKLASLEEVPVVVKDVSPQDSLEIALIENIQRQDLNPLEEAEAYQRLVQEFGLSQEDVAQRVGKERSTVANMLRINQLPDFAKTDLAGGVLTAGHARVLLSVGDPAVMKSLRDMIVEQGMSVRRAESEAKKLKIRSGATPAKPRKKRNALPETYCKSLTNDLTRYLGTRSRIVQTGSRGRVEIEYYSSDDLERLLSLIVK